MKAITFRDVHEVRYESVRDPALVDPGDAVVRVTHTAVCGSDLHVYNGRETGLDTGTVLGHECIGEVVEVGAGTRAFRSGDRVVSPFSTACGSCAFCREGLSARCTQGQLFGWVENGRGLHGAQAEFVRVPLADTTLVPLPGDLPAAAAVLLADVLPTGFHCARQADVRPGGVYAVIGCGPVGLMAVLAAVELGAAAVHAIDRIPERLQRATALGAIALDASTTDPVPVLTEATEGRGVDAVLEAVGSSDAARLAYRLVRPGGVLSFVGVHTDGRLAITPPELYDKNITLRLGRCPARSLMEPLIPVALKRSTDLASIFTHSMPLSDGARGYDLFDRRADGCIKVLLQP